MKKFLLVTIGVLALSLPVQASEDFEDSLLKALAVSATTTLAMALSGHPEIAVGSVSTTVVILFQDYLEETGDDVSRTIAALSSSSAAKKADVVLLKSDAQEYLLRGQPSVALDEFLKDVQSYFRLKNPAEAEKISKFQIAALMMVY